MRPLLITFLETGRIFAAIFTAGITEVLRHPSLAGNSNHWGIVLKGDFENTPMYALLEFDDSNKVSINLQSSAKEIIQQFCREEKNRWIVLPKKYENQAVTDNFDGFFKNIFSINLGRLIIMADKIIKANPIYSNVGNNCQHFARKMYAKVTNDC